MQYDGKGKLREAIAGLYGLSPGSVAQIAAHIKKAKAALNITSKSKNLPDNDKLAIYQWHWKRLNAANAVQADILGEPLDGMPIKGIEPLVEAVGVRATPETEADTPAAGNGDYSDNEASATLIGTGGASSGSTMPLEPLPSESGDVPRVAIESAGTAIDSQPMADTTEPQRSSNWGGVRQGSGRKATGRQTVTMRVPVELAGMIGQLKAIGDTQGQAALLAVVSGLESALPSPVAPKLRNQNH